MVTVQLKLLKHDARHMYCWVRASRNAMQVQLKVKGRG